MWRSQSCVRVGYECGGGRAAGARARAEVLVQGLHGRRVVLAQAHRGVMAARVREARITATPRARLQWGGAPASTCSRCASARPQPLDPLRPRASPAVPAGVGS